MAGRYSPTEYPNARVRHMCCYCCRIFPNQEILDEHVKTYHDPESPHVPPTPPSSDISPDSPESDISGESSDLYMCRVCYLVALTQQEIVDHLREVHPDYEESSSEGSSPGPYPIADDDSYLIFMCPFCRVCFIDERQLHDHIATHLQGHENREPRQQLQCPKCKVNFYNDMETATLLITNAGVRMIVCPNCRRGLIIM